MRFLWCGTKTATIGDVDVASDPDRVGNRRRLGSYSTESPFSHGETGENSVCVVKYDLSVAFCFCIRSRLSLVAWAPGPCFTARVLRPVFYGPCFPARARGPCYFLLRRRHAMIIGVLYAYPGCSRLSGSFALLKAVNGNLFFMKRRVECVADGQF